MTQPTGLDQSGSKIDPAWAAAHGVKVIYGYLAPGTWKATPPDYIRACHAAGVGYVLGMEMGATDPLGGAAAGVKYGALARADALTLIGQVGYAPKNRLALPWSFDWDVQPGQYAVVDAAARAYAAAVGPEFDMGDYGSASLLDHLHTVGLVHSGEFGTYAWSNGHVSAYADMQQYLNGQTLDGASVDFDRLVNSANLGAWWPPGHELDSVNATQLGTATGDDDMDATQAAQLANVERMLKNLTAAKADGSTEAAGEATIAQQVWDFSALTHYTGGVADGWPTPGGSAAQYLTDALFRLKDLDTILANQVQMQTAANNSTTAANAAAAAVASLQAALASAVPSGADAVQAVADLQAKLQPFLDIINKGATS